MPQNPLSGRALSALTVVPDLQPTDRFALLRPTSADPLDQNVTLTSDRLQFALLATLTPVVLTALAGLLAAKADLDAASGFVVPAQLPPVTFANTTGSPLDNPLLRALLTANGSGSITRTYAQAQADAAATPPALQTGKLYRITNRPNGVTTDVLVQALSGSAFSGNDAYSQDISVAGAPLLPVTYVFATDTVTARVVVLPTTAPLTTNALRGGPKLVDYLTPFAGMAPFEVALSQMPLSGLAIGTRAFVQNPTAAPASGAIVPAAYYVLARCAPTDPLAVSAFVNGGGGAVTLQTPAKWVAENSAEGQAAFFALFDPAGRTGTNDYPTDYVVKYVENGRLGTYEATQYLLRSAFGGSIPAPGGASNAYWRPYAPAVAGQTPYLSLTLAAAQSLAADPDTIQAILYHVLRGAAGDVLLQGIPSRPGATALDPEIPGGFSPVGVWYDAAAAAYVLVDYNVTSNVVTPRKHVWKYIGDPANGNIVRGAEGTGIVYGAGLENNTFGSAHYGNSYGNSHYGNSYGDSHSGNSYGNDHVDNTFGNGHQNNAYGNGIGQCTFGSGCTFLQVGDNCTRVKVTNCFGTGPTGRFAIPANSIDVEYRNNALVVAGSDPLKANLASPTFTGTVRVPNATGADQAMAFGQGLIIGTSAITAGAGNLVAANGTAITALQGQASTNATNIANNTTAIGNEVTARTTADNLKADKALTGYTIATGTPPALAPATDTVLTGLGKLENRANANAATAATNAGNIASNTAAIATKANLVAARAINYYAAGVPNVVLPDLQSQIDWLFNNRGTAAASQTLTANSSTPS